ncbi:MAG: hypothetical protein L6R39_006920 [Caloplaca ligustica]|nr:MAG: hypothetical protein L6R39_006920 [Caloplaca ligustica]
MALKGRPRGFEELKIFVNPSQASRARFPRHREPPAPRLAPYRNNLTALSQYYNLLFVASLDKILVYQPVNQEQLLTTPSLTINLGSSNSGVNGYMDHANPHAINQLIVADLGIEEIVAAVCDDGDVVAYTTRSIQREIEDRPQDQYDNADFISQVRPFFLANVGMSAWGIAVHKKARMIAVSSNSRKINVFAFALCKSRGSTPESGADEDTFDLECLTSSDDQNWKRPTETLDPSDRQRDLELVFSYHSNNIPNIAFFNPSDASVEDVYLVSTDINGVTCLWDVWKRKMVFQFPLSPNGSRGWGVACIDPYFCRGAHSFAELFGANDVNTSRDVVNISHAAKNVPDSSEDHFTLRLSRASGAAMETDTDDDEASGNDDEEDMEEFDPEVEAADYLGLDQQTEDDGSDMQDDAIVGSHGDSGSGSQAGTEEPADHEDQPGALLDTPPSEYINLGALQEAQFAEAVQEAASISSHFEAAIQEATSTSSHLEAALQQAASIAPNRPQRIRSAAVKRTESHRSFPASTPNTKLPARHLPLCVLHTTECDIRLFHSIRRPAYGFFNDSSTDTVVCERPLHQHLPANNGWTRMERLNMVVQIPELGVVIIGDQSGRVALLTMTGCRVNRRKRKADGIAFRFERFLPLMSQEDSMQRPHVDLLGVAAGPISSQLFKRADGLNEDDGGSYSSDRRREAWKESDGSRRYRVMLYYRDHTILSYEIGRPPTNVFVAGA